jgi:hypothetical protein
MIGPFEARSDRDARDRHLMTLIAPASIVTAVCSNGWSMAGNDGARQNRTAKVPSQHDCAVIEFGAACLQFWCPSLASTAGATSSGTCSDNVANQFPIAPADPPGALLPAVSFFGGFRTPAPVPVDRSRWPASETHHKKRPPSFVTSDDRCSTITGRHTTASVTIPWCAAAGPQHPSKQTPPPLALASATGHEQSRPSACMRA